MSATQPAATIGDKYAEWASAKCFGLDTVAHPPAAVLWVPQGVGKSTVAREVAKAIGCIAIVDDWRPGQPLTAGALHITNAGLHIAGVGDERLPRNEPEAA